MKPVRKHEPIHEGFMDRKFPRNTWCQLIRDTYSLTDDPQIKLNLRILVSMGKSMVRKLKSYDAGWDKDFWDDRDQE